MDPTAEEAPAPWPTHRLFFAIYPDAQAMSRSIDWGGG